MEQFHHPTHVLQPLGHCMNQGMLVQLQYGLHLHKEILIVCLFDPRTAIEGCLQRVYNIFTHCEFWREDFETDLLGFSIFAF